MKSAIASNMFGRPHGLLLAAVWALGCCAAAGARYEKGQLIPELKLKNGTVLHEVTVVAVGSSTVLARWAGGRGSILLTQLPDELRVDLTPPVTARPAAPAAVAAVAPAPVDPQLASMELPTDVKLTNGFVMHGSSVTRWTGNSVLISYQGGIVSVLFSNIVPAQRAIFEARKNDALTQQASDDASHATSDDTAAREAQAQQAAAAQAQADADQKAEEISKGISSHYLVKGMTKEQVIEAFGMPMDEHADAFVYLSRGHDKYGNSADRSLTFQDGLLTGWRDARDDDPAGAVDH